ncbi:uncharacterized protein LOC128228737 [Mya arenaria]|uniref:uncharacterized protein LOC128228737 n=1 Tax=Mya arenaria TaxID=6604 RepID=UPI0022E934E4|nr:uncharacterized protein LOC128228737 [Mya arenaria]
MGGNSSNTREKSAASDRQEKAVDELSTSPEKPSTEVAPLLVQEKSITSKGPLTPRKHQGPRITGIGDSTPRNSQKNDTIMTETLEEPAKTQLSDYKLRELFLETGREKHSWTEPNAEGNRSMDRSSTKTILPPLDKCVEKQSNEKLKNVNKGKRKKKKYSSIVSVLPPRNISTQTDFEDDENTLKQTLQANEDLRKQLILKQDEVLALDFQIEEYKKELNRLAESNEYKKIGKLKKQIQALQEDNSQLKDRFSKIASERLTDNNPNIADLSDRNRPGRLGDQFSEVYCNEWTEVFESLSKKHHQEESLICALLECVLDIDSLCRKSATHGLQTFISELKNFAGLEELPETIASSLKPYKELRKKNFEHHLKNIIVMVFNNLNVKYPLSMNVPLRKYIHSTTTLCWLMSIQDPPVVLEKSCIKGDAFNELLFTKYKNSGKTYDYLVWPAVLLSEGGPVIRKGVACPEMLKSSSSFRSEHDGPLHSAPF